MKVERLRLWALLGKRLPEDGSCVTAARPQDRRAVITHPRWSRGGSERQSNSTKTTQLTTKGRARAPLKSSDYTLLRERREAAGSDLCGQKARG